MRRMYIVFGCCLVLLFVPIYLWQVKGWDVTRWFTPSQPIEVSVTTPLKIDVEAGAVLTPARIEQLAKTNPVELLERSLANYRDSIKGYTCTLTKHERVHGKLREQEVIDAWFQEQPFSVLMVWKEGHDRAAASLYSVEENREKMFIRPHGFAKRLASTVERALDCLEAKSTNRYLINDFGIRKGTERTFTAWKEIEERGLMKFEYRGLRKCPQAGNRDCHVITRHCDPAVEKDQRERDEGLTEVTIFIDAETGLQVGTVLKAKDELIGEYYFSNIQINPTIDPKHFKREHLKSY